MECPFQVGDEVVCIKMECAPDMVGNIYVVDEIWPTGSHPHGVRWWMERTSITLVGVELGRDLDAPAYGFDPSRFRKVQKPRTTLSIESFLTIKPGQFEEPRRAPAKTPESV